MSTEVVSKIRYSTKDIGRILDNYVVYEIKYDAVEVATPSDIDKVREALSTVETRLREEIERKNLEIRALQGAIGHLKGQIDSLTGCLRSFMQDDSRIRNEFNILESLFAEHIKKVREICREEWAQKVKSATIVLS